MVRIRLNAFHKDSSAVYSKVVEVELTTELSNEIQVFEREVPFSRFYREDEILDIPDAENQDLWENFLENN